MQRDHIEAGGPGLPAWDGCEGGSQSPALQHLYRVTEPELNFPARREVGNRLCKEDKPIHRKPQSAQQWLVEYEHHG
jgi:hypothetical protein